MSSLQFKERWPRDNHILAAIHRALGLPIWAIDRLFFAMCKNPSTVNRVTSRLRKTGMASAHPLYGKAVYLRLGAVAVKKYRLKPTECEPLDYHRLLAAMATVMYCFSNPKRIFKRALPKEVQQTFSIPEQHVFARPYVIRTFAEQLPELLQIRVAMDAPAQDVFSRQQRALREYRKHTALRELIDSQRFVLVTFFPTEVAWRPANALFHQQHSKGNYPKFESFVYPELLKIACTKGTSRASDN